MRHVAYVQVRGRAVHVHWAHPWERTRLKSRKTRKARSILRLERGLSGGNMFIMSTTPTVTMKKSKMFQPDDQNFRYGPPHPQMLRMSSRRKSALNTMSNVSLSMHGLEPRTGVQGETRERMRGE